METPHDGGRTPSTNCTAASHSYSYDCVGTILGPHAAQAKSLKDVFLMSVPPVEASPDFARVSQNLTLPVRLRCARIGAGGSVNMCAGGGTCVEYLRWCGRGGGVWKC
eukprot:366458-Chlamydomonas_euryale.AAC.8